MAHFFRPQGGNPPDYDIDGRLAPDSIWRVRIAAGGTLQVGLWGGKDLWVRSTNPGVVPNDGFKRSDQGDLTFLTLTAGQAGDCKLEVGQGAGVWITLEISAGSAVAPDISAATQSGTYKGVDAAAVVRHFHEGNSGTEMLGGLSRGYMRWLEVIGQSALMESSGPPPGWKPTSASEVWLTYSERPKLLVIREGWTFPVMGGTGVRNYVLEIWWLPHDDTEYQVLEGHTSRAAHGDMIGYGWIMRPWARDLGLYHVMKIEAAQAVVAGVATLVSSAVWNASMRNTARPMGPVPPDAAGAANKTPPTKPGIRVLLVGPETEDEFQYAQTVNRSGGKATAVNPVKSQAADKFAAGGGEFVQGDVGKLPKGGQYDIIREDYPYPTGKFVDTAGAGERISRLKPGGSWVVVTEKPDFADSLQAAATLQGAKSVRYQIPQFHEGTPVSDHPRDAGRFAVIITK